VPYLPFAVLLTAKSSLSFETIERTIQPTDAQRLALTELKAASAKAAERISAACPRELPQSSIARFEVMEKRLDEMLPAVKTVPAGLRSLLRLAQRRAKNAP
jgi:hypothetical protein